MFRRVVLAYLMVLMPTLAGSAEIERFLIGAWSGGAYTSDRSGQFSHCAISASYRSGISAFFFIDPQMQWSMAFSNAAWSLDKGATYDVSYQIDQGPVVSAKAVAIKPDLVRVELLDSAKLFKDFQIGYQLSVVTRGETFRFVLTNSSQALQRALSCVVRYAGTGKTNSSNPFKEPHKSNPFGGHESKATREGAPRYQADTVAFAANLLAVAGVRGYRILKREEVPESMSMYEAVWVATDVAGTVKFIDPKDAASAEELSTIVLAIAAAGCKGKFATARLPTNDGTGSVHIRSACRSDATATHTDNIIVPRRGGGFFNLAVFALGEDLASEAVAGASGKLLDAALLEAKSQQ